MIDEFPLISVIIPTCDRPNDLAQCLERLAPGAQLLGFGDYEVIVSDDGPMSLARDLVQRRFAWAQWVRGARRGPAANRNCGAAAASGEWLVFCDDDCMPASEWLSHYARAARTADAVALEGRVESDPPPRSAWDESPINLDGGCFWTANIAVKAEWFWSVHGFDENYPYASMEDVDMRTLLERLGEPIHFVREAIVNHPARRTTALKRLRRVGMLASHVYYYVKWEGDRRWRCYVWIWSQTWQHWLKSPLLAAARGDWRALGLVAMFPILAVSFTARFPTWYRSAVTLAARPATQVGTRVGTSE